MVRGRAGGTGARFNLGEMTVTRCSVQLDDGTLGHAWIGGRDERHAEVAAVLEALLQNPARTTALHASLVEPLARAQDYWPPRGFAGSSPSSPSRHATEEQPQ